MFSYQSYSQEDTSPCAMVSYQSRVSYRILDKIHSNIVSESFSDLSLEEQYQIMSTAFQSSQTAYMNLELARICQTSTLQAQMAYIKDKCGIEM